MKKLIVLLMLFIGCNVNAQWSIDVTGGVVLPVFNYEDNLKTGENLGITLNYGLANNWTIYLDNRSSRINNFNKYTGYGDRKAYYIANIIGAGLYIPIENSFIGINLLAGMGSVNYRLRNTTDDIDLEEEYRFGLQGGIGFNITATELIDFIGKTALTNTTGNSNNSILDIQVGLKFKIE